MSGIKRTTLANYASGANRPSVDAIRALAECLPPEERAPLVLAHLVDECPLCARHLIRLELAPDIASAVDTPPTLEAEAMDLDAVFAALRTVAEVRREVRDWLTLTASLLQ